MYSYRFINFVKICGNLLGTSSIFFKFTQSQKSCFDLLVTPKRVCKIFIELLQALWCLQKLYLRFRDFKVLLEIHWPSKENTRKVCDVLKNFRTLTKGFFPSRRYTRKFLRAWLRAWKFWRFVKKFSNLLYLFKSFIELL